MEITIRRMGSAKVFTFDSVDKAVLHLLGHPIHAFEIRKDGKLLEFKNGQMPGPLADPVGVKGES